MMARRNVSAFCLAHRSSFSGMRVPSMASSKAFQCGSWPRRQAHWNWTSSFYRWLHLEGTIDPAVPRPIVNGHASVGLLARSDIDQGIPGGARTISRTYETAIDADGTFRFDSLPQGEGQILAWCQGWCSIETLPVIPEDSAFIWTDGDEDEQRRFVEGFGDYSYTPQRVRVPGSGNPLIVFMQRTATLEVTVQGPDRQPLEGAIAWASPNVSYGGGGSGIYPWGKWSAHTDSNGIARIENLPGQKGETWVEARHDGLQLRMSRSMRLDNPSVVLRPGKTSTLTIQLLPEHGMATPGR